MKWIDFVDGLQAALILSGIEIIFDISQENDGARLQITITSDKMEADAYDCLVYERKGLIDFEHAKRDAYNWLTEQKEKISKYLSDVENSKDSTIFTGSCFICTIGKAGFAVVDGQGRRYDRKDGVWKLGYVFHSIQAMLIAIGNCIGTTKNEIRWQVKP